MCLSWKTKLLPLPTSEMGVQSSPLLTWNESRLNTAHGFENVPVRFWPAGNFFMLCLSDWCAIFSTVPQTSRVLYPGSITNSLGIGTNHLAKPATTGLFPLVIPVFRQDFDLSGFRRSP